MRFGIVARPDACGTVQAAAPGHGELTRIACSDPLPIGLDSQENLVPALAIDHALVCFFTTSPG